MVYPGIGPFGDTNRRKSVYFQRPAQTAPHRLQQYRLRPPTGARERGGAAHDHHFGRLCLLLRLQFRSTAGSIQENKNSDISEQAAAQKILGAVAAYFSNEYDELFATDIGNWTMELTNTEGSIYKFRGSLCADFEINGLNLSDLIRDVLGMEDLYVFDGNPNRVDRVAVDYHRVTRLGPVAPFRQRQNM